jgi:tetratricopeptide (TPR) repeat protein
VASLNRGRLPEAQHAFEQAVKSDPRSALARDYLGIALLQQRQYGAALREFREEVRLQPDSAPAWARVADVYEAQRDLQRAITALEQAIKLDPELAQLHFNVGVLYAQYLQLARAVAALRRCVDLEPANHYARFVLARLLLQTAQLDAAQRELEQAIAQQPGAGDYHLSLGRLLLRRRATAETSTRALAELDRALVLGVPQPEEVHYYRGLCLQRQGKWRESAEALETATRLEPALSGAFHALSTSYLRLGRAAEARAALARFGQLHEAEEARKLRSFYTEEVDRNRDDPDASYQLGAFLASHGDVVGAVVAFRRAAELGSERKQPPARLRRTHERLEELYRSQGMGREADAERVEIRRLEQRRAG